MGAVKRGFIFLALFIALSAGVFAVETPRVAVVKEVSGQVEFKAEGGNWVMAEPGMVVKQGDMLRSQSGAYCLVNVDGAGETASVELKENSQVAFAELIADKKQDYQKTLLDLSLGQILIEAQKLHSDKSRFEVKTPTSIVGVRGTTFSVSVEAVE